MNLSKKNRFIIIVMVLVTVTVGLIIGNNKSVDAKLLEAGGRKEKVVDSSKKKSSHKKRTTHKKSSHKKKHVTRRKKSKKKGSKKAKTSKKSVKHKKSKSHKKSSSKKRKHSKRKSSSNVVTIKMQNPKGRGMISKQSIRTVRTFKAKPVGFTAGIFLNSESNQKEKIPTKHGDGITASHGKFATFVFQNQFGVSRSPQVGKKASKHDSIQGGVSDGTNMYFVETYRTKSTSNNRVARIMKYNIRAVKNFQNSVNKMSSLTKKEKKKKRRLLLLI